MSYRMLSQKPAHFAKEMQDDLDQLREKGGVTTAVRQLNEAHERGITGERARIRKALLEAFSRMEFDDWRDAANTKRLAELVCDGADAETALAVLLEKP